MQPGESIKPDGSPESPQEPAQPVAPAQDQQWQFNHEAEEAYTPQVPQPGLEISWTASEFIAHHKPAGWYFLLILGAIGLAGITFLVTRDMVAVTVTLIVGVIFAFAAARQPRTLPYRVNEAGITIGEKFYPYVDFKSFSVRAEGAVRSIFLLPMKRFMPAVTVYYPPEQENEIVEVMGMYLPHEDRQVDAVDRLMSKLRF